MRTADPITTCIKLPLAHWPRGKIGTSLLVVPGRLQHSQRSDVVSPLDKSRPGLTPNFDVACERFQREFHPRLYSTGDKRTGRHAKEKYTHKIVLQVHSAGSRHVFVKVEGP